MDASTSIEPHVGDAATSNDLLHTLVAAFIFDPLKAEASLRPS